jgi:hypothetical protein
VGVLRGVEMGLKKVGVERVKRVLIVRCLKEGWGERGLVLWVLVGLLRCSGLEIDYLLVLE